MSIEAELVPGNTSVVRKRPIGTVLLAMLLCLTGLWVAWQRFFPLIEVYSTAEGPVAMSASFKAALIEDGLYTTTSVVAALGLLLGAQWGWWLGAFHWTWRLGRYVILPAVTNAIGMPVAIEFDVSAVAGQFLFCCLLLLYMFKRNILGYFGLGSINKSVALVGLLIGGVVLSLTLDPLHGLTQLVLGED